MIKNKTYNVGIYDEFWRFCHDMDGCLIEWMNKRPLRHYLHQSKMNETVLMYPQISVVINMELTNSAGVSWVWMNEGNVSPVSLHYWHGWWKLVNQDTYFMGSGKVAWKQKCSKPFGETILEFFLLYFPNYVNLKRTRKAWLHQYQGTKTWVDLSNYAIKTSW